MPNPRGGCLNSHPFFPDYSLMGRRSARIICLGVTLARYGNASTPASTARRNQRPYC